MPTHSVKRSRGEFQGRKQHAESVFFLFRGSSWNVNHSPGARGCSCRWCLGQTPAECFISTVEGKRASVRLNISAPRRVTEAPLVVLFHSIWAGVTDNRRPQTPLWPVLYLLLLLNTAVPQGDAGGERQ